MPATSSAPGSQPQAVAKKNQKAAVKAASSAVKTVAKQTAKAVTTGTTIQEAATATAHTVASGVSSAPTQQKSKPKRPPAQPLVRFKAPQPVAVKVKQDLKAIQDPQAQKAAKKPIVVAPHLEADTIKTRPHKTLVSADIAHKAAKQVGAVKQLQKAQPGQKPQRAPQPIQRKVKQRLKQAAKKSVDKPGGVKGPLLPGQAKFAKELAKLTGLDPRTVAAQELQEENGSAAQGYAAADYNNWLNVQPSVVGGSESPSSHDSRWGNPKSAAKLTYQWMLGNDNTPGGGAAPSLTAQLKQGFAAKTPEQQAAIIGSSQWGTGDFSANLSQVSSTEGRPGKPIPQDLKTRAKAVLGAQTTKKVIAHAKHPPAPSTAAKMLPGPLSGSKTMVQKLVGSKVHGDHGVKNEGYVHTAGGDHYDPNSYAQDINNPSGNPAEGEPPYNQSTLNTIVKNARKLGFQDVPDLKIGQNYEGVAKGYRLQLLTNEGGTISHIHVGIRWEGASATSAPTAPATTGTAPATGTSTTTGGAPGGTPPSSTKEQASRRRRKKRRRRQVAPLSLSPLPASLDPADYAIKPSTESYDAYVQGLPIAVDL